MASLYGLSTIIGPPLMTQLFGAFSSESAPVRFPGASFMFAALLTLVSFVLFERALRAETPRASGESAP